jgi:hypothetical protein
MSAPLSLHQVLLADAELLRDQIQELMESSNLQDRLESVGGRVVMMTTNHPFRWVPLPVAARQQQTETRQSLRRLDVLIRSVLADQPLSIHQDVSSKLDSIREVIDHDKHTDRGTPDANGQRAAGSISDLVQLATDVASGDEVETLLIPDTNALYAQPRLEHWQFQNCPRFALVIVPAVVSELDRHKDHHPNKVVVEKAQTLIRQIGEYRRRGRLVDGVTLRNHRSRILAWPREPDVGASLPWLDAAHADDRLIASAIEVGRSRALSPLAIVTRDLNLQTKCEFAHLDFLWPPEAQDEDQQKGGAKDD